MELMPGSRHQEGEGKLVDDVGKRHFHVLAVDDSLVDRKLLERLLGSVSISYQVTFVDSGCEALQYLGLVDDDEGDKFLEEDDGYDSSSSPQSTHDHEGEKKVNLIMTDYNMPGINGYDLLRRVKGSNLKDVPVVMMSSENIPSRISMCMEGGAHDFLLKPLKVWDLDRIQPLLTQQLQHPITSSLPIISIAQGNYASDNIKDDNFSHIK